jgi:hypothetical protein
MIAVEEEAADIKCDVPADQAAEIREIGDSLKSFLDDGEDICPTIIAHFHSEKTKTLLTDEPDVFRSLLPELKRRGIWDLLDHVGLLYSGWTLEEEAYPDDINSKDELAQYHDEVVQEYGSLGNHPARKGVHILQAYSHGVFLIRKYDHETLQVLAEAITDDPDSFGGTMML